MGRDEWEDNTPENIENEDEMNEEPIDDSVVQSSGKYDRLLGEDSRKFKLSGMFREWFLDYSSYVILQRAVPHIVDGLKPVQRRVLHAMFKMDDGNYTKVANIVGQAMQFHPHGDQSIIGALVQLGQKDLLIDCQGNWGNILTGDSNAAPRYIEARLSKFAKDVVFDPKITNWMTNYDGRYKEPTELPVRFPLLLAQGTEGIAVGMASKILPHNFNELIDASIAILKGEDFELYPDFPTGGYADCTKYMGGRRGGSVKCRAKIEKIDKNTIAITELPYGKTTHVLIDSIMKAKDKGKIKIRKIEDMTSDKVEILIHLPNDVSPDKTIDALYAFTDCEINIAPNACVIVENKPQFLGVDDILRYDTEHTKDLLRQQLEIRMNELEDEWHYNSLERIFFENKVYKILEQDQKTWEIQLDEVLAEMKKYQSSLRREVLMEDVLKLVERPVRKISKFDTKVIDDKIKAIEDEIAAVRANLDNIVGYTIEFFLNIRKKYGKNFPRLTEISNFETIAATKVVNNNAKLYANMEEGFVGIGLKKEDNGEYICDCSDLSEIVVIDREGKYRITKVSDKAFFSKNLIFVGVFNRNDERTIYNVIYRDGKSSVYFAKRFAITSITRDKDYDITQGKPGSVLEWFSVNYNGEAETVKLYFKARPKLKKLTDEYDFSTLAIKGKASRGNLVTRNQIRKIELRAKGISTIGGKDIWYDADVQRLNEDERGVLLGNFTSGDNILAVFRDGTFYTTNFDLSNRYQGEVLLIEKFDEDKTFAALYFDGGAKTFYVKRFSFVRSDNSPLSFISDAKGSYLVAVSEDVYPRFELVFGGKNESREREFVDAEEFIGKKGYSAKGKRCSQYEIKSVAFVEPVRFPDPDEISDDDFSAAEDEVLPEAGTDTPDGAHNESDRKEADSDARVTEASSDAEGVDQPVSAGKAGGALDKPGRKGPKSGPKEFEPGDVVNFPGEDEDEEPTLFDLV